MGIRVTYHQIALHALCRSCRLQPHACALVHQTVGPGVTDVQGVPLDPETPVCVYNNRRGRARDRCIFCGLAFTAETMASAQLSGDGLVACSACAAGLRGRAVSGD